MAIDVNVHPLLYKSIYDESDFAFWEREFGMGHMGPMDYDEILAELDYGGIEKSVLLPLDLTTTAGGWIATNEQVASIVKDHPDRFVAFASVDPHRPDAPEALERAFTGLGARGL